MIDRIEANPLVITEPDRELNGCRIEAATDELGKDESRRVAKRNARPPARVAGRGFLARDGRRRTGIIATLLRILAFAFVIVLPFPDEAFSLRFAVLFAPSLILVVAGLYALLSGTSLSVQLATCIVTLAVVAQALFSMDPLWMILSVGCVYLVWRTARQAKQQLRSN
jgi:hypothetical protein